VLCVYWVSKFFIIVIYSDFLLSSPIELTYRTLVGFPVSTDLVYRVIFLYNTVTLYAR